MTQKVSGNLKGLAPSQQRQLHKLFERKIDAEVLVGLQLAREMYGLASELRRRIGVLVSREGKVEEVFVGTRELLYLPDLGRYRLGEGRLRRLRLLYTDLSKSPDEVHIPSDIYADLEKLRLDAVVGIKANAHQVHIAYAYNVPYISEERETVRTERIRDFRRDELDFQSFIRELENEHAAARRTGSSSGAVVNVKEPTILVGVYRKGDCDPERSMEELSDLARTAGVNVVDKIIQIRTPDPKTLLGKGKLEALLLRSLRLGAEMIIFDTELRPSQWRVITNSTNLKVLDRSMLILDIFAQRATSSDGRRQVELAQLKYTLPRLVEQDAGLSRLTGGIGGRGPGETKLEIGRRRLRDRIRMLERMITKFGKRRETMRKRRVSSKTPLIAILGYTNVGKSTLFNALTGSTVVAENKLFATLDPAQRKFFLSDGIRAQEVVLADTVGFIRDLPIELMNAFRATLEELYEAHVLVHVLDGSDPDIEARKQSVDRVLEELELLDLPLITVVNKIDRLDEETVAGLERQFDALPICAQNGQGFEALSKLLLDVLEAQGSILNHASIEANEDLQAEFTDRQS